MCVLHPAHFIFVDVITLTKRTTNRAVPYECNSHRPPVTLFSGYKYCPQNFVIRYPRSPHARYFYQSCFFQINWNGQPHFNILIRIIMKKHATGYRNQKLRMLALYTCHDGTKQWSTALYCIVLHCTALYCIVLHCTTLYCTVLHCTALYCTVLHCTALYCIVLHCTVLHCTVLHCTTLHCTALYCAVLHCTILYCTALYCAVLHCTILYCTRS
jgi:hypothetical protein